MSGKRVSFIGQNTFAAHERHESRLSPEIQRHTHTQSGRGVCVGVLLPGNDLLFGYLSCDSVRLLASLEQLVESLRAENERLRGLLPKEAGLKPIVGLEVCQRLASQKSHCVANRQLFCHF